ncbi:MAG TPA: group I intron-associated PD-(D/E)XK endonuclease [Ktedonosporobacter sp.]|nr:group I intron-associated PD-(D/E)XK endonuclease [Ktedonosporobacter sp.]
MAFRNEANLTPNAIGEISQGAIAAAVMKYGYTILVPFGEAHRYDMVIEKGSQFFRIQCKTGRYVNGVVKFNACSSNWWNKTRKPYTKEEIDYFAVYCEFTGNVYLVPVEEVGSTQGSLRIEPTENNQAKGIRWAEDYEISKVIVEKR